MQSPFNPSTALAVIPAAGIGHNSGHDLSESYFDSIMEHLPTVENYAAQQAMLAEAIAANKIAKREMTARTLNAELKLLMAAIVGILKRRDPALMVRFLTANPKPSTLAKTIISKVMVNMQYDAAANKVRFAMLDDEEYPQVWVQVGKAIVNKEALDILKPCCAEVIETRDPRTESFKTLFKMKKSRAQVVKAQEAWLAKQIKDGYSIASLENLLDKLRREQV